MMYTHSSPEPEAEDDFAALKPRLQRSIDRAFDRAVEGAPSRIYTDAEQPSPSKRRKIGQKVEAPAAMDSGGGGDDDGGGFLPPDEEEAGGGFLPPGDGNDDGDGGGFVVDETEGPSSGVAKTQPVSSGPTHIPLSLVPRALQILDLPQDPDVLNIFRQAASGWRTLDHHADQEDGVSRKDWRAVCAVLMADPRDTGMERASQSSSAVFSEREMEAEGSDDGDDDDERDESPVEGNDDDYGESESNDEDDDDDDEEYEARSAKRGAAARKTRSAKRGGQKSPSLSEPDQGPVQLTARQRKECLKAFALFFPDFADDKVNLVKQRILIKDVARVAKMLKEKLATEEILEMLEAFSTSPDKSMSLADFEQMMMVTHSV
ncbi:hypothetical protein FRB94_000800 [Tulasnella sp. JGI-2019a]|nr:hypothetical protein FRB94_000800 [Tulasnella sp. JGI-2019a]